MLMEKTFPISGREDTGHVKHYLFPSAIYANKKPSVITTVLGTCVAVCLWDPISKIGGINHYMLPLWNGEGLASPKYGNIAIGKLIEMLLKMGASKEHLQAKVFGGKTDLPHKASQYRIGERNAEVAIALLKKENIPVVASSLGGNFGRHVQFFSDTGEVFVRLINY